MLAGLDKFFWFIGRVEDIYDPLQQGRVRVRCYGYHEDDATKLPTDKLPWAFVAQPTNSAGLNGVGHSGTGLLVGSEVFGFFADGVSAQVPIIIGTLGTSQFNQFIDNGSNAGTLTPPFLSNIDPTTGKPFASSGSNITLRNAVPDQYQLADPTTIGNLTQQQTQKLKAVLAYAESSGDYTQINQYGYSGRYQFGYSALQDVGFVNKLANSNSSLNNPQMWVGKMGVHSIADWLTNKQAQEVAMDLLLANNYKGLLRTGIVAVDTPPDVVGGYLCVCHLLGLGGAINLKRGIVGQDANGTTAIKYYAMGSNACKVV